MGLIKASVAQIRHRPSRVLLTGVAITVATLFTSGTVLFTDTLRTQFSSSFTSVSEDTAAVIEPSYELIEGTEDQYVDVVTEEQLEKLSALPEVTQAVPSIAGTATSGDRDLVFVAGGVFDGPLSYGEIIEGNAPTAPDEIVLTPDSSEEFSAEIGDTINLAVVGADPAAPAEQLELTVSGIARTSSGMSPLVITDPETAMQWQGKSGYDGISLAGADEAAVVAAASEVLGEDATVQAGSEVRAADLERSGSGADQVFLLLSVFLAIALLAAAIIVASTFRILLVRSRQRTALLRCVGAQPGHILRALLVEAALSGLIAGAVGVAGAVGLGYLGTGIASAVSGADISLTVSPVGLAGCLILAVLVSVFAAAAPAIRGSKISPVAAMNTAVLAERDNKLGGLRKTFAVLATLVAVALGVAPFLLDGLDELAILTSAASGCALFAAYLAAGPAMLRGVVRVLEKPAAKLGGISGRMAVRNTLRAPRRAATTTAVFALGVTLVTAVLVSLANLQFGAERHLESARPADAQINSYLGENEPAVLTPELVESIRNAPAVGDMAAFTTSLVDLNVPGDSVDHEITATGGDLAQLPALEQAASEGSLEDWAPGRLGMATYLAEEMGITVGDTVTLRGPSGEVSVEVAGLYESSATMGSTVLHPDDVARISPDAQLSSITANPADGVDTEDFRTVLNELVPLDPRVVLAFPGDEREAYQEIIDIMRLIALGLVGITVLVAMVGVTTTLSLSVVERTQEHGLLRALGLRGNGLRAMLSWEAAILGAYATVLGIILGTGYAMLITLSSPGLGAEPTVPVVQLVFVLVTMMGMALLASLLPAGKAAKSSPMHALVTD